MNCPHCGMPAHKPNSASFEAWVSREVAELAATIWPITPGTSAVDASRARANARNLSTDALSVVDASANGSTSAPA